MKIITSLFFQVIIFVFAFVAANAQGPIRVSIFKKIQITKVCVLKCSLIMMFNELHNIQIYLNQVSSSNTKQSCIYVKEIFKTLKSEINRTGMVLEYSRFSTKCDIKRTRILVNE